MTAPDLTAAGAGLGTVLEHHHADLPAEWIDGAAVLIIAGAPPGIARARWSIMSARRWRGSITWAWCLSWPVTVSRTCRWTARRSKR